MSGCDPHTDKFKNRLKDSRARSENITYSVKNAKYIINKECVYFALTESQVFELLDLLNEIIDSDIKNQSQYKGKE